MEKELEIKKLRAEINEDKEFYRKMTIDAFNELKTSNVSIIKELKENNKIMTEQNLTLNEVKISLQSKPCMIESQLDEVNKGWKDSTIKAYQAITGALLLMITGILASVGLYAK
jgi:hypothetical protein